VFLFVLKISPATQSTQIYTPMLWWSTGLVYSAFPQLPNNVLSHQQSNISLDDIETLGCA